MAQSDNFVNMGKIKIGTYPEGEFAGMKIYSTTLNVSPGGPSKLTVRCVELTSSIANKFPQAVEDLEETAGFKNATGDYVQKNISHVTYEIILGDSFVDATGTSHISGETGRFFKIPAMYLTGFEKNITPSQRTLTLTFIDQSILLDKIFVGLIQHHASDNRSWKEGKPLYAGYGLGSLHGTRIDPAEPTNECDACDKIGDEMTGSPAWNEKGFTDYFSCKEVYCPECPCAGIDEGSPPVIWWTMAGYADEADCIANESTCGATTTPAPGGGGGGGTGGGAGGSGGSTTPPPGGGGAGGSGDASCWRCLGTIFQDVWVCASDQDDASDACATAGFDGGAEAASSSNCNNGEGC